MNITDAPKKQPVPFGVNGQRENLLPTTPAGDNTASYDAGFPPVTMILKAAGGLPPKGQDMNQILFELSSIARWFSAGGGNQFDSAFSTAVSGYPLGATVLATDGSGYWISTANANATNPENATSVLTGWLPHSQSGVTLITGLAAANVTLTTLQAGKARIELSGTLTANINLIFPAWAKGWVIANKCTGNFAVTCKTISGTGVAIASGATANITGDGTNIALDANVMNITTQVTGVVGATRNAAMSIATASATATFTADEVIVGTAFGGAQYRIGSFSKAINLATTGAGGMDTGTITSGYLAIYAIYNPTTGASALLGFNPSGAIAPNVYAGTNMPAGYTASALVSVWLVTSSQLGAGYQNDRDIFPVNLGVISNTAATTTPAVISFPTGSFPMNAKNITGYVTVTATASQTAEVWLLSRPVLSQGVRFAVNASSISAGGIGQTFSFSKIPISTPSTLLYEAFGSTASTFPYGVNVTGYSI